MRNLLIITALLCFIGVANLPIGYYTLLRIVVCFTSITMLIQFMKNGFDFWVVSFSLLALLFNPILPVYLNDKPLWIIIDIIAGGLFLIKSFTLKL